MAFTTRKLTRLKGWDKYNTILKKYRKQPIIKNIDTEAIKAQFAANAAVSATDVSAKEVAVQ